MGPYYPKIHTAKVENVREASHPRIMTDLRSFIGKRNVLRLFIVQCNRTYGTNTR